MTVLFADVEHSTDIASGGGRRRALCEMMAKLADFCAAVVHHYGGTVESSPETASWPRRAPPVALEDHAARACLASLGIQEEAKQLAVEVQERDGVDLRLRVGLNSGQVIAGEIGFGFFRIHRYR